LFSLFETLRSGAGGTILQRRSQDKARTAPGYRPSSQIPFGARSLPPQCSGQPATSKTPCLSPIHPGKLKACRKWERSMAWPAVLLLAAFGYLVGSLPSGYWIGRLFAGRDVRAAGSGNIGATNVARLLGLRYGLVVLALDIAKGVLPVTLVFFLWPATSPVDTRAVSLVALTTLLGSCYSLFLQFQGGKGVATACGISLTLWPKAALCAFLLFGAVAWRWRYVSLASLAAAVSLPLWLALFDYPGLYVGLGGLFALFISFRHRSNIRALVGGRERKWKAD
jgi:glycerol-3-phosphate acyltransferase PlsY